MSKPILSIEAFADWCEKQPAAKAYSYSNCGGHCALGQYLVALGLPVDYVGSDHWRDLERKDHPLPRGWDALVMGDDYFPNRSHTFGALAARLRATLPSPKQSGE